MIKGFVITVLLVLGASQVDQYCCHGGTPTELCRCCDRSDTRSAFETRSRDVGRFAQELWGPPRGETCISKHAYWDRAVLGSGRQNRGLHSRTSLHPHQAHRCRSRRDPQTAFQCYRIDTDQSSSTSWAQRAKAHRAPLRGDERWADAGVGWIAAIIIGGIAGWLAEQFMKSSMGLIMNIVLGIVGAAIASAILSYFGIALGGWIGYLISGFIGAVLLIWIVRVIRPA